MAAISLSRVQHIVTIVGCLQLAAFAVSFGLRVSTSCLNMQAIHTLSNAVRLWGGSQMCFFLLFLSLFHCPTENVRTSAVCDPTVYFVLMWASRHVYHRRCLVQVLCSVVAVMFFTAHRALQQLRSKMEHELSQFTNSVIRCDDASFSFSGSKPRHVPSAFLSLTTTELPPRAANTVLSVSFEEQVIAMAPAPAETLNEVTSTHPDSSVNVDDVSPAPSTPIETAVAQPDPLFSNTLFPLGVVAPSPPSLSPVAARSADATGRRRPRPSTPHPRYHPPESRDGSSSNSIGASSSSAPQHPAVDSPMGVDDPMASRRHPVTSPLPTVQPMRPELARMGVMDCTQQLALGAVQSASRTPKAAPEPDASAPSAAAVSSAASSARLAPMIAQLMRIFMMFAVGLVAGICPLFYYVWVSLSSQCQLAFEPNEFNAVTVIANVFVAAGMSLVLKYLHDIP
jgi:hypothetical protein